MRVYTSELGLPLGRPLPGWKPCPFPPDSPMIGQWCRVEPLNSSKHGLDLFKAFREDREHRIWTYLPYGPFESIGAFLSWIEDSCTGDDPKFHAIVDAKDEQAVGVASYLRITPPTGVIEVGHINYSPRLQRTPAATEAMYLMMRRVFALGYRRYEWKCDALNERSRNAALRFGFRFEGVFRNATITKGRNRDTAWFSVIDSEWPAIEAAFEKWLDPANFDAAGQQIRSLGGLVQADGARADTKIISA